MKKITLLFISFLVFENVNAQVSADTLSYSYKKIHNENCVTARQNKKNVNDELLFCDTTCSTIDIDLLFVSDSDSSKSIFLNSEIESSLTKIEEDNYGIFSMADSSAGAQYDFSVSRNFNKKNIFSYSISSFVFACGAAHPSHDYSFFNYDLKTKKKISLDELFISDYKDSLKRIAEKLFLEQNKGELEYLFLGEKKFELNQNFLIQKDGLLFLFNEYEIGAYVAGAPEVLIPYKEISELINKKGILARLIEK